MKLIAKYFFLAMFYFGGEWGSSHIWINIFSLDRGVLSGGWGGILDLGK
jgi:hypothetical protein